MQILNLKTHELSHLYFYFFFVFSNHLFTYILCNVTFKKKLLVKFQMSNHCLPVEICRWIGISSDEK